MYLLQRLTILDTSDNEIGALPEKFSELKWLRVARLSRNHIVDMNPLVGLTGCEELDLSQNEITQIPDTISRMTSLATLDLSRNAIKDIPIGVCKVPRLSAELAKLSTLTRNTLHCDQSNYSSRIVFSHILIEFGPTRNSAIRSADPENPILEPKTE